MSTANTEPLSHTSFFAQRLAVVGMMIVLTMVMLNAPLGAIMPPMIHITIARVSIFITTILFGLSEGLVVAFAFSVCILLIALTSLVSILDPLFVNPLVSILPRVIIPVTTYLSYRGLQKLLPQFKGEETLSVAVSLAIGSLTNTFSVYAMLYLLYATQILEETGTPALSLTIGLISISTAIRCAGIVLISTPIVLTLYKALQHLQH